MAGNGGSPIYVDGPWSHRPVTANGTRFHIAEAGEGPLVLLLHGFPQFWWTWRAQLEALSAAGYRAVAADLRGYGGSDKPPRGYDLITAASDAAGMVRALGEANAVVVGHRVVTNVGCPKFHAALHTHGFSAVETPLNEFVKAGGSAKCLTLRLDGEEAAAWRELD